MENIACPICRHQQTKELFRKKDWLKISDRDFGIRKCLKCEVVFTFPALGREEIKKFYPPIYLWKKEYETANRLTKLFRYLENKYSSFIDRCDTKKLIKFCAPTDKMLDVGCGTGSKLAELKKAGIAQCFGIEPSENDARYARESKNLPVTQASLTEFECPENSFDAITFYNVFEHLDNPAAQLKIVGKILKPEGLLVIQVPNFNSWEAKLFRKNWLALDPPRHYFHYTPETIGQILSQSGFQIKTIDWSAYLFRPFSWVFSLSRIMPQTVWQKEEKGKPTVFYRMLWGLFLLISILPNIIQIIFRHGGHMTIYAVNKK